MASEPSEHWQSEPDEHDYPAAESYLGLLCDAATASALATALRTAPTVTYKAKDLLRASRLALLERSNAHVAKDFEKVRQGKKLSPVLLVHGRLTKDVPLTVADGYHRICASYWIDEDAAIPCRAVDLP
jgi:hypothetical protein